MNLKKKISVNLKCLAPPIRRKEGHFKGNGASIEKGSYFYQENTTLLSKSQVICSSVTTIVCDMKGRQVTRGPSPGKGATYTVCKVLHDWSREQKNEQQNNALNPKKNTDAGY